MSGYNTSWIWETDILEFLKVHKKEGGKKKGLKVTSKPMKIERSKEYRRKKNNNDD